MRHEHRNGRRTAGFLAVVAMLLAACGATQRSHMLELRSNESASFRVNGQLVGRGRMVRVDPSWSGDVEIVAEAHGYRPKTEVVSAVALAGRQLIFTFMVGDRLDGRDTWGQVGSAAPAPGPSPGETGLPQPRDLNLSSEAAVDENAFALVIGIEQYSSGLPAATGAVRDAVTFAELATRRFGVPRKNVALLTGSQATRSALQAYLSDWLPRNLKGKTKSKLYFFFSGHGAPDVKSGDAYLVPWDGQPQFITSQGLGLGEYYRLASASGAGEIYSFIDACFSGVGPRSVLPAGTRPLVLSKGAPLIATPKSASNTSPGGKYRAVTLAAAGPSEAAGEAEDRQGGLFSYYLTQGLTGHADSDKDGKTTLGELRSYLEAKVVETARRQNREQTPFVMLEGYKDSETLP
jgi:hypothetical protein